MNQLLSICIPTFNRHQYLDYNLANLIKWVPQYDLGIYISDNCSTDATKKVVEKYQHIYKRIYYYRQDNNIGADANFQFVLEWSQTDYAWLLGDDDIIDSTYVDDLLDNLQKKSYDLCVVNAVGRVTDIPSKIYSDKDELLYDIGWHMQYMSCLLLGRDLIRQASFEKYKGTSLIQFAIIFDYLGRKETTSVMWNSKKLIRAASVNFTRTQDDGWAPYTFDIFLKNWTDVIEGFSNTYSQGSKSHCIMEHGIQSGLFSFSNLKSMRKDGIYNKDILKRYKPYFVKCVKYKLPVLYFLAYCVPPMRKIRKNMVKLLRSKI